MQVDGTTMDISNDRYAKEILLESMIMKGKELNDYITQSDHYLLAFLILPHGVMGNCILCL